MNGSYTLTYSPMGDRALLIQWPSQIDTAIIEDIWRLRSALVDPLIVDYIVAYHSLTLVFLAAQKDFSPWIHWVQERYADTSNREKTEVPRKEIVLPVYYNTEVAPDLERYLEHKKMSLSEMIRLHTQPRYTLFFYGFQPGFMYLGGLEAKLVHPRKERPSAQVRSGSVAIGGAQTGIYPHTAPGGWHVIGHCPLVLFDPNLSNPCVAMPGDLIRFRSIELPEYHRILEIPRLKKNELSRD